MTVRDATRRESPDGLVLYIEDLRTHLGVRTNASESSSSTDTTEARPEVILIGHDMQDDFQKLEKDGIDIPKYLHYSGCVDTHAIIDDTGARIGKSLSDLVSHYGLAKLELKKPGCPKIPPKWCFVGSHCAGNDAVATLGSSIALALDLTLKTSGHEDSPGEKILPDDWLEKPLQGMNTNMILLAYDTEGVETPKYKPNVLNRTSEHGFAWMRIADVAHIPPGEHGKNWRPFFHARHWINQDFRNFKNWFYCVGNPNGFWPQYGESQYYRVSEGPAPFHKLFEELANVAVGQIEGHDAIEEVTSMLEQTTIGESTLGFDEDMANMSGNIPNSRDKTLRGMRNMQSFRGISARGNGKTVDNRDYNPNHKGNSTRGNEKLANNRGYNPTSSGNFTHDGGNIANNRGRNLNLGNNFGRRNKHMTDNRGTIPNLRGNMTSGEEHLSKIDNNMTLGGGDGAKNKGNDSTLGDNMGLDGGNGAKSKGNDSTIDDNITLGGGNGAKNKGKGIELGVNCSGHA